MSRLAVPVRLTGEPTPADVALAVRLMAKPLVVTGGGGPGTGVGVGVGLGDGSGVGTGVGTGTGGGVPDPGQVTTTGEDIACALAPARFETSPT